MTAVETAPKASAKTLVLFAHPAVERARLGPALVAVAQTTPGVVVRDLYELYPDFTIDVEEEQKALRHARTVILQFPFYWYSVPALMKEWMDLVLSHGFAYGPKGKALDGKILACAISTGGTAFAYNELERDRYSMADFLRPIEQTARMCRMHWKPSFVVHDVPSLSQDEQDEAVARYIAWLGRCALAPKP